MIELTTGLKRTVLTVIALAGLSGTAAETAGTAPASWASTMIAKRAAFQQNTAATESKWWSTGPIKAKAFNDPLFPELGVNLDAKSPNGRALWTEEKKQMPNGVVHPFKSGDSTSTYFYRTLTAKQAGKVKLGFGSDDGIEVWFNQQKVLSKDLPRGAEADQDIVTVDLKPGTNSLLLKVFNRTGDSAVYYSSGSQLAPITTALADRFPEQMRLFKTYLGDRWFRGEPESLPERAQMNSLLKRLKDGAPFQARLVALTAANTPPENPAWLNLFLDVATVVDGFDRSAIELGNLNLPALRLAVDDLSKMAPDKYRNGAAYRAEIDSFEKDLPAIKTGVQSGDVAAVKRFQEFSKLARKALLENPLLDFEKILLVKRKAAHLGLPQNWQGNSSISPRMENELATLDYKNAAASVQTLFKPGENYFVGDVDLHFDADKMLFSSIGTHKRWQVFELKSDGSGLRQVTKGEEDDVDNYDPMYLPDGRIIYVSTATFLGVPCVGGSDYVGNLFLMNPDGTGVRRLCFDQDNDWCPVMLPNGRVMYLRWEYTDSAHYFSRVLMSMNPDGTTQTEFYGSDSYWPNSLFFARPLPGSATKFAGIVTGHHGVPRMGELVIFDAAKGRQEGAGAIQRIPGYGKEVKPVIKDALVNDSWPKFLHPFPLSEKHFLVAAKPTSQANWGIYLVDAFDNMVLLKEEPGYALLEPLPLRAQPRPPVIQDKVNLASKTANVLIHDVYAGEGLKGVPRGMVKNLRVYQYEYSYRNMGGHYFVGMEGPWDVRRIIGTVPVKEDGSAHFVVPANTPVAVQPLDAEGKALQLMRSWFVGMPGENVSCVGCHERQNQASGAALHADAATTEPIYPTPWRGPKRGFSFVREVQPVLDKYCVGCHDGTKTNLPNFSDPKIIPTSGGIASLPKSYTELHPYIRRNGPEGDYHTLTPLEFHADTSLMVQQLRKGHFNVQLDEEGWDRLITWIDLNVPAHGTFKEIRPIPGNFEKRRYECKKLYAGVDEDIEAIPPTPTNRPAFMKPAPLPPRPAPITLAGWPMSADKAKQLQANLSAAELKLDLGNGVSMALKKVPGGEFPMGDVSGDANEFPMARVKIARPFYVGATEVTAQQFAQYDSLHRNGYYDMHYKDQVKPGYLMDTSPQFPVIRVSWHQAMGFCNWLAEKTGRKVTLPTEAQWEWACRAGTDTPFYYGDRNADFGSYANLSDATMSQMAVEGVDPHPKKNPDRFWDYLPKDARFNDGVLHLADAGHYKPNAWGLYDMIGNVAEWTRDTYRLYPYTPEKAANDANDAGRKVVRGGSWSERPKESRAASRLDYPAWQKVYNVGFRVIVED